MTKYLACKVVFHSVFSTLSRDSQTYLVQEKSKSSKLSRKSNRKSEVLSDTELLFLVRFYVLDLQQHIQRKSSQQSYNEAKTDEDSATALVGVAPTRKVQTKFARKQVKAMVALAGAAFLYTLVSDLRALHHFIFIKSNRRIPPVV